MATDQADDVFATELQKLYHIENHLIDFQTELADEVTDSELNELFSTHQEDTQNQIERLEGVFRTLGKEPQETESPTMEGILAEYETTSDIQESDLQDTIDLGLAMGIERLEITSLETLQRLATKQNHPEDITEPLETTRREAEDALQQMQSIAS